VSTSISYFNRFNRFDNGSWTVREGQIDALIFTPNQTIKVFGIGLFQTQQGTDFTLGYRYYIQNLSGNEISRSELIRESVSGQQEIDEHRIIKYKFKSFPDGIVVKVEQ